jgi:hypothetical protein
MVSESSGYNMEDRLKGAIGEAGRPLVEERSDLN